MHWKLPTVSVQSALVWQLSVPSIHSFTSEATTDHNGVPYKNSQPYEAATKMAIILTHAKGAILQITGSADTVVAAYGVHTVGICKTENLLRFTALINVCK